MKSWTTNEVRELYDGFASWWAWCCIPDTLLGFNRLRGKHFSVVTGHVLDVACGTGENFRYLRGTQRVTAVDLSPQMVARARRRAERMGMDVMVQVADAAALPFPDDSFDYLVTAASSCTFPDYVGAFREMERVARPDGRILLLEHGRSSVGWIARRQDRRIDKLFEKSACRNNRDPRAELEEGGLHVLSDERSHLGMVHRFVVVPQGS